MKKNLSKLFGGVLLFCTLFINAISAQALSVNVTSRSHDLGILSTTSSVNLTGGYGRMEITTTTNNVITVKLSLANIGDKAESVTDIATVVTLPTEVVSNFSVALGTYSSHGTPSYTDGANIINWNFSTLNANDTAYMVYTLTPKASPATSVLNTKLYVATSTVMSFINNSEGPISLEFLATGGCVPSFTLTDGSSPNTGLFTNIALLVGIIGASVGILVLSSKKTNFKNI